MIISLLGLGLMLAAPAATAAQPVPRQSVPQSLRYSRLPAPLSQNTAVQPVAMQFPVEVDPIGVAREGRQLYSLEPPSPERLFRLESDAALRQRMQQEYRAEKRRIEFPEDPVLTHEQYQGRHWPRIVEVAEPNYVCYRRPYFEQLNFERYGWEIGFLQPAISTGKFYWDVFFLPYNMGTEPFRHYECNAGYCLPGDPVPLYLYPPHLNLPGAAAQAGALTLGFVAFP